MSLTLKEIERKLADMKVELLTTFREFDKTNPKQQKIVFAACIDAMIEFYKEAAPCKHPACLRAIFNDLRDYYNVTVLMAILEIAAKGESKHGTH